MQRLHGRTSHGGGSRLRRLLLALGGAALLLGGCRADDPRPGDVLLITVDALRPDHLGLYGYDRPTSPGLDRWLAPAEIFERAYSAAGQTAPAVVSLLSGRLPQDHRVRLIWQLVPPEIPLLPDLLPSEYQTAAFVSNMVLTGEAMGFADRFDHYDDFVDEQESARLVFERNAAATVDAALLWLSEERDPDRPLFLWMHLIDPHGPYDPPADWPLSFDHPKSRPVAPEQVKRYMQLPGVDDGYVYVDRYDEEIAYADHHLDRFFRVYSESSDLENSLIVFTSDHGESMMEHDEWFRHGHHVYEEVVRVPLAIRAPGAQPARRASPVSTLDVLPTILGFVGAQPPKDLPGTDLRSDVPDPDRSIFFESTNSEFAWRAELRGDLKWIVKLRPGTVGVEQRLLYDLAVDPLELDPMSWSDREAQPRRLLALCRTDPDPSGLPEEYLKGERLSTPKVSERAGVEDLDRLRTLGYVD